MSDDNHKIKVFGSDDNLKALGELLSNGTSRKIISNLMKKEMYTNELSTKLDMRVSLVIHHLKKMEDLGLLNITNKKIIRKGQEHRFFKINSDIFITLNNTKEEVKEKGILKRIFRESVKLGVMGVASFFMWQIFNKSDIYSKGGISLNNKVYPLPGDGTESLIWVPVIIIICGILLICFRKLRKKRK